MSKVSKVISVVASVVAVVATFIPGGQPVAAIAGAVAATAGTVSQLTAKQKRPGALGAVNSVIIGANMPIPYAVGRTYVAGSQVYEDSGGTNAGGVQNAVRQQVRIVTGGGPVESFESFLADFSPITFSAGVYGGAIGYYQNVLDNQVRYGNWPETAHDYNVTAMPNWSGSHRLSGYASYRVAMWFDKTGERYSGGVPQFGMVGKWVKVYDPRKDSTYPGGSGSHRWNDESTWEWSENGALHALTYARGRYIEKQADGYPRPVPFKVLGCGFDKDAIELADFVEAANLADTNGWTCGGLVFDGPEISRWDNLKRFCETFAAQPVISGGRLRLKLFAPRPSLFTLTEADLADGGIELRAMKPFQERRNSVVYRYRSESHRWEHVQGEAVTISTYLADDGGDLRTEEVSYDLVQDKDQAAQLATAKLIVDRQFGPLTVACKPRLMRFRPGEAGTINLPELGLSSQKMVITGRQVDPATGVVTLTLESEPTEAEYDFALGRTGTAPPTPVIRLPSEADKTAKDFRPDGLTEEQLQQIATLQGLVDGNLSFFYSASEPGIGAGTSFTNLLFENGVDVLTFENGDLLAFEATGSSEGAAEGDLWYNPDISQWYQLEGGFWVTKNGFGAIGAALITAASASNGLADGKATIFYTDVEPTAKAVGDLWIKQSGPGRTVKSWTGSAWEVILEVGADVTSYIVPSADSFSVQTDASGVVKAGQLPRTISASLVRNGSTVTSGVDWSYRVVSGSFNTNTPTSGYISVAGAGVLDLSMTAVGASGAKIELRSTFGGTSRTKQVDILIAADAPPSGGGSGSGGGGVGGSASSISSFQTTSAASTTYGISDNDIPVVSTGSLGRLTMTTNLSVQVMAFGVASATPYGLFQYRTVGGSWIDAGAEAMGTIAENYRDLETGTLVEAPGSLTYGVVVNGLTANTDYETRLRLRDDSATRTLAFYGTAGTQGS